jgi:hypothetical protein
VHSAHGTSWNNKRLCAKADAFHVSKHSREFHADESSNIFTKHPSGLASLDSIEHCRPEEAVIICASLLPGDGKRLARESARDEVTLDGGNISHVSVVWHVWPVFFEDFARIRFYFAESDCLESGRLRGKREATDAGK